MILPLDSQSARELGKHLGNVDGEQAKKILLDAVTQARANQTRLLGKEVLKDLEKFVVLSSYDELWMDHLDTIDDLRDGIRLRGYAQKDPLVEYKQEAFNLFESLLSRINFTIARKIFRFQPIALQSPREAAGEVGPKDKKKLGRNDPCWCGSGKKYKQCHYPN